MIVTCANCQTKYNLPDGKIPEGGAKVKCSKCAHVFKVEPLVSTPEEEVESLLDEEAQAPDTQAGDDFDETFNEVAADEKAAAEEPAAEDPEVAPEAPAAEQEPVADEPVEKSDEPPVEEAAEEMVDDDPGDLFAANDDGVPAGDAIDDLFDDAQDELADEPVPEDAADEEMPGVDDLFDDSDAAPEPEEGPSPAGGDTEGGGVADGVEALFGDDDTDDLFAEDEDVATEDDLFADDDESDSGGGDDLFADASGDDDLFADDEDGADDDQGDVFEGDTDFGLDQEPEKKKPGKALPILIVLLILILGLGAAVYFKAWTLVGLNSDSLKNVPVIGKMFMEETGGEAEPAPGESPADRVRKIELRNVKQYYVANEKIGNLFVVEGKAVNKFESAKEQIKVEVILYDGGGNVLRSQSFLGGNQLSQFQLQVQTRKEVEEGLASEVGILSNNTFVRPGGFVPFMAVFFEPPAEVKEFLVKVVDVADPK